MKRGLLLHALALSLLVARASAATVQDPPAEGPIFTDRPGFLFCPKPVPKGRLQVETGLPTYTDFGGESWSLSAALRYGLSERLELRASLPAWIDPEGGSNGFGDSEIGVKWALPELAGDSVALQAGLRVPTGEDGFTTDEVGANAFLLHGRDLGNSYWLQTMLGAIYTPVDGGEDQTRGEIAALVSHPIVERWTAYVEATLLPGLNNASGQSYLGAAVIFNPNCDSQVDVSADFGLGDDSADVIAALGFSWRF